MPLPRWGARIGVDPRSLHNNREWPSWPNDCEFPMNPVSSGPSPWPLIRNTLGLLMEIGAFAPNRRLKLRDIREGDVDQPRPIPLQVLLELSESLRPNRARAGSLQVGSCWYTITSHWPSTARCTSRKGQLFGDGSSTGRQEVATSKLSGVKAHVMDGRGKNADSDLRRKGSFDRSTMA